MIRYGDVVLTFREGVSGGLGRLGLHGWKGSWDAGTDAGDLRRYRKALGVAKEAEPLRGSGGAASLGTPDPVVAIWQAFAEGAPRRAARRLAILRQRAAFGQAADQDEARVAGIEAGLRHAKRCLRCGRTLTDPESISRGIGPDCWDRVKGAA